MTKHDYRNEVRRLAGLLWGDYVAEGGPEGYDVYTIMDFVAKESAWMHNERLHEKILEHGEYDRLLGEYDHNQIAGELKSGDDWKMMRMLTAKRTLALNVFDELDAAWREGVTPKKRWEPE